MMSARASILEDLDDVLQNGSSGKRADILRHVTDLFLNDAERLTEDQVRIFDNVLMHLVDEIEARVLAQFSARLAPIENAPPDVIRHLARHDAIVVAEPVLRESVRLSDDDLVEIASVKSQDHLLAISGRAQITAKVTDVLLYRGDKAVTNMVAANTGARFSKEGFAALLKASKADDRLAETTGLRLDIPRPLLRELLLHATETVRQRLLFRAPPDLQDEIHAALQTASEEVDRASRKPRDFEAAKSFVTLLKANDELDEAALMKFARARRYEEAVVAVALMSTASIEIIKPLMQSPREEGLLIPCKVAGLSWETVNAILDLKLPPGAQLKHDRNRLKAEFQKLTKASAERLLRFWQVRQTSLA